jgi:cytochrome c oxidase subunit 2
VPYTDEAIRRAITEGVEPDGEPLESPMPRWSMSDDDLGGLLEFLKTLD